MPGYIPTSKYPNSISRVNGYDDNAYDYYPVVIVGGGETGVAMGCRLKEVLGFDQFRIFERQAGVGGTWWINRYPGVACDVPAIFYSFSFSPNHKWTSFHPPGDEIVKYLNDVCAKYGIADKIQCNTDVESCRWLDNEEMWELTLRHMVPGVGDLSVKDRLAKIEAEGESSVFLGTQIIRARIVASAVGGLVEPKGWPENIPGADTFEGEIFHSARWRDDVDMTDKNVVVLGTGCSAAQFVPRLTKAPYNAKSVTQLMRSPPWVVPRLQPPFGEKRWSAYAPSVLSTVPGLGRVLRTLMFCLAEYDFRLFGNSAFAQRERTKEESALLRHLRRKVPAEYHEILTPDYGVGCKRRIFDATWFPSLSDPAIELTTQPLRIVHPRSVTIGPGRTYPAPSATAPAARSLPADVLILANGFDVSRWLHPLRVTGRGGADLLDTMDRRGGPQAYQGTAMDGFPNFFILFGPNTATGHSSVILASENMVNYALRFIGPVLSGDARTVEVKREAEEAYTADLQAKLKETVWMAGGCSSWYFTEDGWNSTVYPYTQVWFTLRCLFPRWSDWEIVYTRKGRAKRAAARAARVAGLAGVLVLAWRARRGGRGLGAVGDVGRSAVEWVREVVRGVVG